MTSAKNFRFPALLLGMSLTLASAAQAQTTPNNVGVGTTTPDASAVLDASSTTQGLLTPRMSLAQRNAIGSPATGLLVYQTDGTPGFYVYSGTAWTAVGGAGTTGATGPQGATGPAGPTGPQGPQGTTGTTGSPGPQGATGTPGAQGATGNTGAQGPQGTAGTTGAQGPIGSTGPQGAPGTNGTNGQGVPTGGTTGQVLTKVNATDYNTQWSTPTGGGTFPSIELNTSVTSSQTITPLAGSNTYTPLVFSASNNANAALTGGNTWNGSVFTVGATGAGWYQVSAQMTQVTSTGASTNIGVQFFLDKNNAIGNASAANGTYPYALSTYDLNASGSNYRSRSGINTLIYLAANDQITFRGQSWSTSAIAYTSTDGSSNLTIVRLK